MNVKRGPPSGNSRLTTATLTWNQQSYDGKSQRTSIGTSKFIFSTRKLTVNLQNIWIWEKLECALTGTRRKFLFWKLVRVAIRSSLRLVCNVEALQVRRTNWFVIAKFGCATLQPRLDTELMFRKCHLLSPKALILTKPFPVSRFFAVLYGPFPTLTHMRIFFFYWHSNNFVLRSFGPLFLCRTVACFACAWF